MPSIEAKLSSEAKPIRVAVGVVKSADAKILIARRQQGQHLAGLWEFPGGKIEPGESREQALYRELLEEVGISVAHCEHLMTINHRYASKNICLEILFVEGFAGTASGVEGQEIKWVAPGELLHHEFPEANQRVVEYLIQHHS